MSNLSGLELLKIGYEKSESPVKYNSGMVRNVFFDILDDSFRVSYTYDYKGIVGFFITVNQLDGWRINRDIDGVPDDLDCWTVKHLTSEESKKR